jgi:hypothetical protein
MANLSNPKSTGETIRGAARGVGQIVAEKVGRAADWLKDQIDLHEPMGFAKLDEIKPGMLVLSSCGCLMGTVDHMDGNSIELTRKDSPDGQHQFLPTLWVARVDDRVYLNKNADEIRQEWASAACVS